MGLIQTADPALSPKAIEAKLTLPDNMRAPLQRVVLAGLKVMFDERTHQLMLTELQRPGPLPEKLGLGIAGLMATLFQEAQRAIPPQLLIPAGLVLLAHAVEFVEKSGQQVSKEEFGQASEAFVDALLKAFQLDPDKVAAAGAPPSAPGAQPGPPTAAAPARGARNG